MNPWRLAATLAAVLALLFLVACGGGGDDDDDGGDDTSDGDTFTNEIEEVVYDVTYNNDAVIVDDEGMADVISVSEDRKTVVLEAGSDTAEDLEEGDVVLIAQHTFGTVESIEEDGDEVEVTLGEANLADIIQDGEISWKDDIVWNELSVSTLSESFVQAGFVPSGGYGAAGPLQEGDGEPDPTFPAPDALKFSGEISGWEVEFELKPTADRLEMALEAKFGDVMAVTGEGFISNFTEETLVKYEDSQFGEAAVRTTELETELTLEWHAFSRNEDQALTEVTQFTIPVSFDIPFFIGPIPFTFAIKAGLQVVPAFESEASSGGSWKVHYSSSQGFTTTNTLGGAIGRMTGAEIDTTSDTETVTSGLGPAGFAVGVEFPRFELAILGDIAVAFVTLKTYSAGLWTPGTTLTADIPPCQMGFTEVSAIYGYALTLLGGIGVEGQAEIWKQRTNKFLDDPCSLDGGPAPEDTLNTGPGDPGSGSDDEGDDEEPEEGDDANADEENADEEAEE
jgi:hypothetical protein